MKNRANTIKDLNSLKVDLERLASSLRSIQEPQSRIKIIEDFKKGLAELRRGVLDL